MRTAKSALMSSRKPT
jgi:hypothetical protein